MDTNGRFQIVHPDEVCIFVVALRSQTVDAEPMQQYVATPSWIGLHSAIKNRCTVDVSGVSTHLKRTEAAPFGGLCISSCIFNV